jgi:hypothetical protein
MVMTPLPRGLAWQATAGDGRIVPSLSCASSYQHNQAEEPNGRARVTSDGDDG